MEYLNMDASSARNLQNLSVLKSEEPSIECIVKESSHAEVYKFDPALQKWDRIGVAGSVFIVNCSKPPYHRLMVLNKQGCDNYTLALENVKKIKLQPPYIMMRCSTEGAPVILGLWLHEDGERNALLDSIKEGVELAMAAAPSAPRQTLAPPVVTVTAPQSVSDSDLVKTHKKPAVATTAATIVAGGSSGGSDLLTDRDIAASKRKPKKSGSSSNSGSSSSSSPGGPGAVNIVNYRDLVQQYEPGAAVDTPPSASSAAVASPPPVASASTQKLLMALSKSARKPGTPATTTPIIPTTPQGLPGHISTTPVWTPASAAQGVSSPGAYKVAASLLLSPSDITGVRRKFKKSS